MPAMVPHLMPPARRSRPAPAPFQAPAAAARLPTLVAPRVQLRWMENRDLMLMGGYSAGQDADLDTAVRLWPRIRSFIAQETDEAANFQASRDALLDLLGNDL